MKIIVLGFCALLGCIPDGGGNLPPASVLNFNHLQNLTEHITLGGDSVDIVHVYSNYPDYHWVGAAESGPEGVACVDDAARAAVLYMRHYELTRDSSSLAAARRLLLFVRQMQTDDGEFYNFVFADHTINRTGKTSYKSFGWWAARGIWAMATGARIFKDADPGFASDLQARVQRSLPHAQQLLKKYGEVVTLHGYRVPQWLLYESGADVTSELLLGLEEYFKVSHDTAVGSLILKLADALMIMQDGDAASYPYGLHRSWQTMWHMWGNGQTQALARAGMLLGDSTLIASCEREANGFYSRLLIDGFFKEMDVADSAKKTEFEQIAYGVRPMCVGLVRLYQATGKKDYLVMAGLAASWLYGNNPAGTAMYDPSTGRCYDGIRDPQTINRNSGAESTIEALASLLEVEQHPEARKFLDFRKVRTASGRDAVGALFTDRKGNAVAIGVNLASKSLLVLEGEKAKAFVDGLSTSERQ